MEINIAELLKDCPKGMELDCTMFDNVTLFGVNDRENTIFPIRVLRKDGSSLELTKYGQYGGTDSAKCVIFPKGKTTWEGFHRPFKDGDVVVTKTFNNYVFYSIYKTIEDKNVLTYIDYTPDNDRIISTGHILCLIDEIIEQRLATEEEKKKLFDAIKAKGYKWNAETKTLEKLIKPKFKVGDIIQDTDKYKVKITEVNVEDEFYRYESMISKGICRISFSRQDDWELVPNKFDISTLKPFESKVLIRGGEECFWKPAIFGFRTKINFYVLGGNAWEQCIPFKNNEHLLGTTDDCDEFYKTW